MSEKETRATNEKDTAVIDDTVGKTAQDGDGADTSAEADFENFKQYVFALSEENTALNEENKKLKEQVEQSSVYYGQLAMLKKDFDAHRVRVRNASETAKDEGKLCVIDKLLPILDTFSRAESSFSGNADMQKMLYMLRSQFEGILAEAGLAEVEVLGKPFDPSTAEALDKKEVKEKEKGIVLEVYSKGYKYNDKIVRYAKVKVGV